MSHDGRAGVGQLGEKRIIYLARVILKLFPFACIQGL